MRGGSGVVTSPGYPGNYGNQADCTWILLAEPGDTISVIFTDFQTEEKYDYLEVEGSEPPTIWWVDRFIHIYIFDLMCYCLGFFLCALCVLFGYCAAEKFHYVALWHFGSVHLCQIQCLFTLKRFSAWEWDESESGCRCLSRGIFPGGKAHSRLDSDAESPFKCDDEQFKALHRDTRITISICFGSGWKVGIFGKAVLLTVSLDIWCFNFKKSNKLSQCFWSEIPNGRAEYQTSIHFQYWLVFSDPIEYRKKKSCQIPMSKKMNRQ